MSKVQEAVKELDPFKDYLLKALEASGNMIDKALDIVQTQAPLIVEELLKWNFIYSLSMFIFGILIIIIASIAAWKAGKAIMKSNVEPLVIIVVFGWVGSMAFSLSIINLTWLKIWVAPRIWLLEYAANLIKG